MVELLAAKVWLLWTYAAFTAFFPYLNVYFRTVCGFSASQIGLLLALRPWCVAASGSAWAALADHTRAYRAITLAAYAACTLLRGGVLLTSSYAAMVAIIIAGEVMGAPIGIISDAAIVAASKKDEDYGKTRMWGAVGWGGFSPIAGLIMTRYGIRTGFIVGLTGAALGFIPTLWLPWAALHRKKAGQQPAPAAGPPAAASQGSGKAALGASPDKAAARGGGGAELHADSSSSPGGRFDFAAAARGSGAQPSAEKQGQGAPAAQADAGAQGLPGAAQGDLESGVSPQHRTEERRRGEEGSLYDGVALHAPLTSAPELQGGEPYLTTTPPHSQDGAGLEEPLLGAEKQQQKAEEVVYGGLGAKMRAVLGTPGVLPFCCTALIMGFGMGAIDGYLFIYLNELGGSETLMGLTILVTCLAEIPVFFYTGALLRALGVTGVLHLVQAAFVVRLLCYAGLKVAGTPWAVLPIELLHGLTFGCAWASGCVHCQRLAPPGLGATMQALFQGLYQGVGLGLGGLWGGVMYNRYGPRVMFLAAAVLVGGSWALCTLWQAPLWGRRAGRRGGSGGEGPAVGGAAEA